LDILRAVSELSFHSAPSCSGNGVSPHARASHHNFSFLPGMLGCGHKCDLSLSERHAFWRDHSGFRSSAVLHLEEAFARMNTSRANARSPYMEWAKLCSTAKFNLATSGMASLPLAELDVKIEQLEINGPSIYGYEPLLQAIAARYRVPRECVVSAIGTSLANYLALAAATEPGDEILVEQPTYDPLLGLARFLALNIRRFRRNPEQNFE